jgi:hypothetical protein
MDTLLARDSGPEMAALWSDAKRQIREVLATLTPREERIIRLRFGLNGVGEHTFEACDPSVTRERVRQIEAKALRKLRHPKRARNLSRPYHQGADGFDGDRDLRAREARRAPPVVIPPSPRAPRTRRTPDVMPIALDMPVFFTSDLIRQAAMRAARKEASRVASP